MRKFIWAIFFSFVFVQATLAYDTIEIPSIKLKENIYNYKNFKSLKSGLMYDLQSTSKLGENGNVTLTGHRYSSIGGYRKNSLFNLPNANIGDAVTVKSEDGQTYQYIIYDKFAVDQDGGWILDASDNSSSSTATQELTIYTCAPAWSTSYRYVIKAIRIDENDVSTSTKISSSNLTYKTKDTSKLAIFNQYTGIEPNVLNVKVGEKFEIVDLTSKLKSRKTYSYDKEGEYTIKGSNKKELKIIVSE
jgi:LPXTG-site transpeptidase (sortase) family protein